MTKMRFVFSKKKKKNAIGFSPKTLENITFDLNIKLYIYIYNNNTIITTMLERDSNLNSSHKLE